MALEVKSFAQVVGILLLLMVTAGILTKVLPAGEYQRQEVDGRTLVIDGSYHSIDRPDYPVWRWFTAPVEVLASKDAVIVIVLIIFMVFVGAAFRILESGGILQKLLASLARRFKARRYVLMAVLIAFFMIASSILGIYEELVPAVVFIVPLALILGWDSMTGLGMSLLALAFGFSAAVFNPFTVGVAQTIAGLPLFSGALFRLGFFLITFTVTFAFVRRHALRVEARPELSPTWAHDELLRKEITNTIGDESATPGKAGLWLGAWFSLAVVFIVTVTRFKSLSSIAFPVVALIFLIAGVGAGLLDGMRLKEVAKKAAEGAITMLPPVVLILMAMSVKIIIQNGGILDTVLFHAASAIKGTSPLVAAFLMYAVTLALEFFIASASAKAFLVMPILVPLCDLIGLTRQTAVLAYDLGDGFSNMLYPTNALLLIALGLVNVSYGKWLRWTLPIQLVMFAVSMGAIAIAVAIKFGPF